MSDLASLRQKEVGLLDAIYDAIREREREKEVSELEHSKQFKELINRLLDDPSEDDVKKQTQSLKKKVVEEDLKLSKLHEQKIKQLLVDLENQILEKEKVEDELIKEMSTDLRKKHQNLQNEVRFVRDREFYLLSQLSNIRTKHWEANKELLVDHYERFGKIHRGLTKAKLSDDMVNAKSEEFAATLQKEIDAIYENQNKEFGAIEGELEKILKAIVEVEDKIRDLGGPLSNYFSQKVPGKIELARPCVIQFEFYRK